MNPQLLVDAYIAKPQASMRNATCVKMGQRAHELEGERRSSDQDVGEEGVGKSVRPARPVTNLVHHKERTEVGFADEVGRECQHVVQGEAPERSEDKEVARS